MMPRKKSNSSLVGCALCANMIEDYFCLVVDGERERERERERKGDEREH
jgi:hypothetical protein